MLLILLLLKLALAPVLIFIFFIYLNDKYEKEPLSFSLLSLFYGGFSTVIIALIGFKVKSSFFYFDNDLFTSFVMSGFIEEGVKFVFLFFLSITNKNINEKFDGIVYGVFVSLGFAALENIFYVYNPELGGIKTALLRGFLSIPGHGLFGVSMGYHLSEYLFDKNTVNFFKPIVIPTILHGFYNFIVLKNKNYYLPYITVYMIFLWVISSYKIVKYKRISKENFEKA